MVGSLGNTDFPIQHKQGNFNNPNFSKSTVGPITNPFNFPPIPGQSSLQRHPSINTNQNQQR